MADDSPFDPKDADAVAMGLARIIKEAGDHFGGYAMIGGLMKFNVDFIMIGIKRMDLKVMKLLHSTHALLAKALAQEIERREKDVN